MEHCENAKNDMRDDLKIAFGWCYNKFSEYANKANEYALKIGERLAPAIKYICDDSDSEDDPKVPETIVMDDLSSDSSETIVVKKVQ